MTPGVFETAIPTNERPQTPSLRPHSQWDRQEFVTVFMFLDPEYMVLNIFKNKQELPV
jgi:hypothetical protein